MIVGAAYLISNLTVTGLSNAVKVVQATSATFDSSALAGQFIGISYNAGNAAAHTIQMVRAEYIHAA